MKTTKLVMLVMTIAVALFILIPNLSWAADDGASHLQSKMCNVPRRGCNGQACSQNSESGFGRRQESLRRRSDEISRYETAKHPGNVKESGP